LIRKLLYSLLAISLVIVVNQITGGENATASGDTTPPVSTGLNAADGVVEVRAVAMGTDTEITSARLSISSVEVHVPDGWSKMKMESNVIDLKQIEGLEQTVASTTLSQGTYTQIRVSIASLEVSLGNSQPTKAKISTSTLAFTQNFQVMNKNTTVLVLNFDMMKSIDYSSKDRILFNPVVNLLYTRTPGSLEFVTGDLPQGQAGVPYSVTLLVIGGQRPYDWSITMGDLTPGLTLDPKSGMLSGIPSRVGKFSFVVRVDDSSTNRKTASRNYVMVIGGNSE
jgi:hypothetical protein